MNAIKFTLKLHPVEIGKLLFNGEEIDPLNVPGLMKGI